MTQLMNPDQVRQARRNRVIKVILDDLAQSQLPSITSIRLAQHSISDEFDTKGNQLSSTAFRDLLPEDAREAKDAIQDIMRYEYITEIIQVGNVSVFDHEDQVDIDERMSRTMDHIENIFSEFENFIDDNPEYADFIVVNTKDGERVLKIPRREKTLQTGIRSRRARREQQLARSRERQTRAPLGQGRGVQPMNPTPAYIMRISKWNALPNYEKIRHITLAKHLGMQEIKRLCSSSNEVDRSEGSLLKRAFKFSS